MNDVNQLPYEDFETIKKKAHKYVSLIDYGISRIDRYGRGLRPIVFISADIMYVITRGSNIVVQNETPQGKIITVFGHEVRLIPGRNVLSVGLDFIERGGE